MSSRAAWALVLWSTASVACKAPAPPARERLLARIPADAPIVVAADGPALAAPRLRAVVDVLRPRWPARFGCVVDAALAGEHVALGMAAAGDVTVVIATPAKLACPPLSQIEPGLWVATLGSGTPATRGTSVLDGGMHARARTYLTTAPIAASVVGPGTKLLATLAPDPLEGWLAIDTLETVSALAESRVRGVVDRMTRTEATAALGKALAVSHDAAQVVVRLGPPPDGDLALAVRTILAWYAEPPGRARVAFTCPPLGPPIVGCANGTALTVTSIAAALAPLLVAETSAVVENERVSYVRLGRAVPSLGLERGDRLLAVDGRRITSAAQLAELAASARRAIAITIQRDAATATLELAEARGE